MQSLATLAMPAMLPHGHNVLQHQWVDLCVNVMFFGCNVCKCIYPVLGWPPLVSQWFLRNLSITMRFKRITHIVWRPNSKFHTAFPCCTTRNLWPRCPAQLVWITPRVLYGFAETQRQAFNPGCLCFKETPQHIFVAYLWHVL